MTTAYRISSILKRSIKPVSDPDYLNFIRSNPCCVTGSYRGVQACHFGPRGTRQKADDRQALPLTWKLHREHHALGTARFAQLYKLDVEKLILEHQALYLAQSKRPKRPITRVRLNPADLLEEVG